MTPNESKENNMSPATAAIKAGSESQSANQGVIYHDYLEDFWNRPLANGQLPRTSIWKSAWDWFMMKATKPARDGGSR